MRKNAIVLAAMSTLMLCLLSGCGDDPVDPDPEFTTKTATITSDQFIRNRFFRLDLPWQEPNGRQPGEMILLPSIKIFRKMGSGPYGPNDIQNVATYIDATGYRDWNDSVIDFDKPREYGSRWREIRNFDVLLKFDGELEAIDMRVAQFDYDILAVVYAVVNAQGIRIGQVGDVIGFEDPTQTLPGEDGLYYRMKILKAPLVRNDPHLFAYELRNIYSLESANIDLTTFDLRIEAIDPNINDPDLDETGIPYVRIFGLDVENSAGLPGADGIVDIHNPSLFDLRRGLLKFPTDFPEPFAADADVYMANVDDQDWAWDSSLYLKSHLAPAFYDMNFLPSELGDYGYFRFIVTTMVPVDNR